MANNINELGNPFFKDNVFKLDTPQSQFEYDVTYNNGFMMGSVVPIGAPIPVLPNQYLSLDLNGVVRTGSALISPILDNFYFDIVCVFVPMRVIWNHYSQWIGENDTTAFTETNEYDIPSIQYGGAPFNLKYGQFDTNHSTLISKKLMVPTSESAKKSLSSVSWSNYFLNCHFFLPYHGTYYLKAGSQNELHNITCLEHRGYYAAWNEFFRDPDWLRPVLFSKTDTGESGEFGYYATNVLLYDTDGTVYGTGINVEAGGSTLALPGASNTSSVMSLLMPACRFRDSFYSIKPQPQSDDGVLLDLGADFLNVGVIPASEISGPVDASLYSNSDLGTGFSSLSAYIDNRDQDSTTSLLYADLRNIGIAINNLRSGVMLQNYQDVLVRTDQRAQHIIEALFGIVPEGIKMDRPILLHHSRHLGGVQQVVATADSSQGSHLGDTGAYSITGLKTSLFTQKFSEHGYVYTFIVARPLVKYAGGFPEQFTRIGKFDNYWPTFDNIGMVPFKWMFINARNKPDDVAGYQIGWFDYKSQRSFVGGVLDPGIDNSFDWWTIAVNQAIEGAQGSSISPFTFVEHGYVFDKVLTANHNVAPQFIYDIRIKGRNGLPMTQKSLPLWLRGRL